MKTELVNQIPILADLSILLVACGHNELNAQLDKGALAARSDKLIREDTALASVYDRSRKTCHAVAGTGAPLTNGKTGWKPRVDLGMDLRRQVSLHALRKNLPQDLLLAQPALNTAAPA